MGRGDREPGSWRARWRALQWVGLLVLAVGALVHYLVIQEYGFRLWSFVLPAIGAALYVVARLSEWWPKR